jgi:hypothetical protein
MVAAVVAVVVLLAVTSVVAEAAAVETVGNRINYLIEKGNHWFPFSVERGEPPILFCNFAQQTRT